MKTRIIPQNIYTLEEVKEKALEKNWDINVDYDWWQCTYMDAEMVGIEIEEFDLDRASYCKIKVADCIETASLILKEHGDVCDTYQLAEQFLKEVKPLYEERDDLSNDYDRIEELEIALEEAGDAFVQALSEEYRIILQKEYDYLTSEEAIEETLRINEYEFDEHGNII